MIRYKPLKLLPAAVVAGLATFAQEMDQRASTGENGLAGSMPELAVLSMQDLHSSDTAVSSLDGVEAVTFAEWPGSDSRDLWWRRQLGSIQGQRSFWESRPRMDSLPRYHSAQLAGSHAEYM